MTKTIRIICTEETTIPSLFDKERYEVLTCEDKNTIVLVKIEAIKDTNPK